MCTLFSELFCPLTSGKTKSVVLSTLGATFAYPAK
jgi:hypothetical protein